MNVKEMSAKETVALTSADHLVGNLWFQLEALPLIASQLEPETMALVAPGPAAIAYGEMCRLFKSASERLSAGSLEAALKANGFDFGWLVEIQARIEPEPLETLQDYARQVSNAAGLRHIQESCHRASQAATEAQAEASEVAGNLMTELAQSNASASQVEHISLSAQRVRAQFAQIREGGGDWGARTGFYALDTMFTMVDGDLIVVGGRPSQGKTSLARQIVYNRAKELYQSGEKGQVVFFSADDTADKVTMGLACALAHVNSQAMRANQLSEEEWARLVDATLEIERLPIYIDDTTSPTIEQMTFKCAMLHAQAPIRLLGMDYLELIKYPGRNEDPLSQAKYAAKGCKNLAKRFGAPFLLLSQLRKQVDDRADKWPTSADVKYAGEEEADVMALLMRPEHYLGKGEDCDHSEGDETGIALVNIAKNKTGFVGRRRLAFVKEYSRFYDVQKVPLNDDGDGDE